MITIEKHIPVPTKTLDTRTKYPFAMMDVGDSFFVERPEGTDLKQLINRMRLNSGNAARRLNYKFVIAVDGDGVRVWRSE